MTTQADDIRNEDERLLAELGYKQQLNRAWSGFSNFAISFSIISVLAGCFTAYATAWNNGGPIAISWGWPIVSALILIIGFSLAELVAKYPTSGGIYWFSGKLGGPKWAWWTGWFNLVGLIGVVASVQYACAGFMNVTLGTYGVDVLGINFGDAEHILAETFFLFAIILIATAIINIFRTNLLAMINNVSVWWHVIGVAVIIVLLVIVPDTHQDFSFVFGERLNNSGFNDGVDRWVLLLDLPPTDRIPAHAVHDYRFRRLGSPLRGNARSVEERGRRSLEVDLLLRDHRVARAARDHVRCARPGEHQRCRERIRRRLCIRGPQRRSRLGRLQGRSHHLHGRAALLRACLSDECLADGVRVLARPRDAGPQAFRQGQPRRRSVQRRHGHGRSGADRHDPGTLGRARHRASGRVLRRDLDLRDWPLHLFRHPDLPALAHG